MDSLRTKGGSRISDEEHDSERLQESFQVGIKSDHKVDNTDEKSGKEDVER